MKLWPIACVLLAASILSPALAQNREARRHPKIIWEHPDMEKYDNYGNAPSLLSDYFSKVMESSYVASEVLSRASDVHQSTRDNYVIFEVDHRHVLNQEGDSAGRDVSISIVGSGRTLEEAIQRANGPQIGAPADGRYAPDYQSRIVVDARNGVVSPGSSSSNPSDLRQQQSDDLRKKEAEATARAQAEKAQTDAKKAAEAKSEEERRSRIDREITDWATRRRSEQDRQRDIERARRIEQADVQSRTGMHTPEWYQKHACQGPNCAVAFGGVSELGNTLVIAPPNSPLAINATRYGYQSLGVLRRAPAP